MKKESYPMKAECPICGHYMNFILDKEATLKSLEDMNWKNRVKTAIKKLMKDVYDKNGNINYDNEKVQFSDSDGYYGYEQALDDLKKELKI